jgi:hypothetical protein
MDNAELKKLYYEIEAINVGTTTLGPNESPSLNTVHRFNAILEEFAQKSGDQNITNYSVRINRRPNSRIESVRPSDLRQNAYTVASVIYDSHLNQSSLPPTKPSPAAFGQPSPISQTFQQNQDNNQSTQISVEFNQTIISLTEMLTKKEVELDDGTPEKGFVQKLKSVLASAKGVLDVIRMILTLATEFGLTANQVKNLLS